MNTRIRIISIGLFWFTCIATSTAEEYRWNLQLDTGAAWQNRNDVRIPGEGGTRVAFDRLVGSGPVPFFRLELSYRFSQRHSFRLLYAPFKYTKTGTLDNNVVFTDQTFNTDQPVDATYRFNSYRATYRYVFYNGGKWLWHVGLTGKIRDAEIALRQNSIFKSSSNVGFVPLLNLYGIYKVADRWNFIIDFDGLASTQGRAFDLGLIARYELGTHFFRNDWFIAAGYRTLEGGADNAKVFNFAWLHYASVSLGAHF